jgi:hypothetical protein
MLILRNSVIMAALPTRRPRPRPPTRAPRGSLVRAELRHVALKDLDLGRRRRARHVLDQLGERHPVGRRGERVRFLAHKVAVHEVLGAELLV